MAFFGWIDTSWKDVRYALRMFARNPGFTAIAALSLALGIGANTAIFSVMDALLLKMLPVKNPEQLVAAKGQLSYPAYRKIRDHNDVFSGMFASWFVIPASVRIAEEAEQSSAFLVSGSYCAVMQIQPVAGRCLTPEDDSMPGAGGPQGAAAMISYSYWERRFAFDPAAVGKSITVNGVPVTIVGVTPRGFYGTAQVLSPDVTMPIMLQPRVSPSPITELWAHGDEGSFLSYDGSDDYGPVFMARLKPGVTRAQAQAEVNVMYQQILAERAGSKIDDRIRRENAEKKLQLAQAGNGYEGWDPAQRALLLITMIAVPGLVLLIACANVANLLLARAAARQKEVAVRMAIGAGRLRLVRQFFTESVMLALLGGLLGLAFAALGRRFLLDWLTNALSGFIPLHIQAETDLRVLAFTAGASLLAAILFGLAPAVRAARADLAPMLKEGARGLSGGRGWEVGKLLVGAQVALSLLLLISAGLLVRSVQNMRFLDPGYSRQNLYLVMVNLLGYKGPSTGTVVKQVWDRMSSLPGARAVGVTQDLPTFVRRFKISVEGYTPSSEKEMYADRLLVGPGFFDAMGIPLLSGRPIDLRDNENAPKACVVSAEIARVFFPGKDPIGRHFTIERAGASYTNEIVGVARDVNKADAKEKVWRSVYCPMLQDLPVAQVTLLVRASGDPTGPLNEARSRFQDIDRNLFLTVRSMAGFQDAGMVLQRFFSLLCTSSSLLALLLASVGLYGVMAYSVARRTNEIGIRMALGAGHGSVVGMVLRETMKLVGIGMLVGLAAALAATRLVATALFGVKPTDPTTIAVAVAVMAGVALAAGYAPARRAAGVDPIIALRHE